MYCLGPGMLFLAILVHTMHFWREIIIKLYNQRNDRRHFLILLECLGKHRKQIIVTFQSWGKHRVFFVLAEIWYFTLKVHSLGQIYDIDCVSVSSIKTYQQPFLSSRKIVYGFHLFEGEIFWDAFGLSRLVLRRNVRDELYDDSSCKPNWVIIFGLQ